jgi:hypothetical protein
MKEYPKQMLSKYLRRVEMEKTLRDLDYAN